MAFLATFKQPPLLMESEPKTNRKGFLKRAGLAFGAVFALSSASRRDTGVGSGQQNSPQRLPKAMARVRTAKGAVVRELS